MNSKLFFVVQSLATLTAVAAITGCSGASSDASDSPVSGDEQDLSAAGATKLADGKALANGSFQALRTLYAKTTYEYQDISGTEAFSFKASASMSDADALALAKAVAKQDKFAEVHQYTLNAAGTPKRLGHLANILAQDIQASGDDTNTPKLVGAMTAAFSLPSKTPGGAIKVFSAIGPGDDHDGDNVDREVLFVDAAHGEVLVLQGQSIDM
ncbi:MAG TPA: hypothetical protein VIF62_12525 [Labilithrix sp.]|jgi:hypothetical protein